MDEIIIHALAERVLAGMMAVEEVPAVFMVRVQQMLICQSSVNE